MRQLLLFLISTLLLQGCANNRSIYRHEGLLPRSGDSGGVYVLDGRERVIITAPLNPAMATTGADGKAAVSPANAAMVTCPDRGVDVYAAAAANGSLGLDAKSQTLNAAGGFSETAAALSRRVTTDLIEDQQYRDCLLYQAGAIDRNEIAYNEVRNRNQSFALLAIESLTNSALAQGGSIAGGADATIATLDAAFKASTDADATAATKLTALVAAGATKGDDGSYSCTGAKDATCADKLTAYTSAAGAAKRADDHYATLKSLVPAKQPTVATASPDKQSAGQTSGMTVPQAVVQIVNKALESNSDFSVFCLSRLGNSNQPPITGSDDVVVETCRTYLSRSIPTSSAQSDTSTTSTVTTGAAAPSDAGRSGKSGATKGRRASSLGSGSTPSAVRTATTATPSSDSATTADNRLYVQVPNAARLCEGRALAARLRANTWTIGDQPMPVRVARGVQAVPQVTIGATQVRYYFDADNALAQQACAAVRSAGYRECRLQSEKGFKPAPVPGLIEVWLANDDQVQSQDCAGVQPASG